MNAALFERIQERREALRGQPLGPDNGRMCTSHETLYEWGKMLIDLSPAFDHTVKLPADAPLDKALFTAILPAAAFENPGDPAEQLAVFSIRNRPEMVYGELAVQKLVVSDQFEPNDELLAETPLLVARFTPSRLVVAHSPLLFDEADPTAWQSDITHLLEEFANTEANI